MLLCSVQGWHTAVKPVFEVVSLERKALGASVPLPKTVIRYILSAVLPRVLQRKLLGLLPQELGQYMLDSGQAGRLAGHSCLLGNLYRGRYVMPVMHLRVSAVPRERQNWC